MAAFDMPPAAATMTRKRSEGRLKTNASTTDARIFSMDREEQRRAFLALVTKPKTTLGNFIPIPDLLHILGNIKGDVAPELNKLSELQQKNEELQKEVELSKNIIADKEDEIQHLLERFGVEIPSSAALSDINAIIPSAEDGDFRKMIADLKNEVQSLKDELNKKETELAEKEKLIEDIKKQFGEEKLDDLRVAGDLEEFQVEHEDFSKAMEQMRLQLKQEQAKAKEYSNQLKNIKDASEMGDEDKIMRILELEEEVARQNLAQAVPPVESESLHDLLNEAEGNVNRLNKELKEALNELEVERAKLNEAEKLIDELQKLMNLPDGADIDERKAEPGDNIKQTMMQDEIDRLKELLKNFEKKNEELQAQVNTSQEAALLGDDDKLKMIAELQAQIMEQNGLMENALLNVKDLEKQLEEEKDKGELRAQKLKTAQEAGSLGGVETENKINELLDELAKQKELIEGLKSQVSEEKRKGESCAEKLKTALESTDLSDDDKIKKINDQQAELAEQKQLMEELKQQLDSVKQQGEESSEKVKVTLQPIISGDDDKQRTIIDLQTKVNDLMEQLKEEEERCKQLKAQLDGSAVGGDETGEQKKLIGELRSQLEEEKNKRENYAEQLKTALASTTMDDDEKLAKINELQSQIEDLQRQLSDEKQSADNCAEQLKTALELSEYGDDDKLKKINDLTAENIELTEQLKTLKERGGEDSGNVQSAVDSSDVEMINELQTKVNDLMNKLNDETDKVEECANKLKSALEANTLEDGDINELKKLAEELQSQLDEEKIKGENCAAKLKTALESKSSTQDKDVTDEELQSQVEDQTKTIEKLWKELNDEKQKADNCAEQLKTALESTGSSDGGDKEKIAELENKVKELTNKLNEEKKREDEYAEASSLGDNELKCQLAEQNKVVEELRNQLDEEKRKAEEYSQQTKETTAHDDSGRAANTDDLQSQTEDLKKNIEDLQKQLKDEKLRADSCAEQLQTALEATGASDDDKVKKINDLQAQVVEQKKQIEEIKQELDKAKEQTRKALESSGAGDEKDKRISDLERQLIEEKQKADSCAEQLQTALESTGASDDDKVKKINDLQAQVVEQKKKIEELKQELDKAKEQTKKALESSGAGDDKDKRISDLERQLTEEKQKADSCAEQLQTALESTGASDDEKVKKINDLQAQVVQQKKKIDDLERRLDNAKEESFRRALEPRTDDDEQQKEILDLERQLQEEKQKAGSCAEQLKTALESTTLSDDDKVKKINDLQAQLTAKEKLINELKEQLRQKEKLQSQIEDEKKTIKDLQGKLKEEKQKAGSCAEQLKTALESTTMSDDDKVKKINDLQAQLAAKEKLIKDLEKKRATLQTDDSNVEEVNKLQKQIKDKNKIIKDLEKQLSYEKFKADQCGEQMKTVLESNTMSFDDKLNMINNLQKELGEQKKLVKNLQDQIREEKDSQDKCEKQLKDVYKSRGLRESGESDQKEEKYRLGERRFGLGSGENKVAKLAPKEEVYGSELELDDKVMHRLKAEPGEEGTRLLDLYEEQKPPSLGQKPAKGQVLREMQNKQEAPDQPWVKGWFVKPSDPFMKRISHVLKLARQFGIDALFLDDLKLLQGAIADALSLQEDTTIKNLAHKKNCKDSSEIVRDIYCSPLSKEDLREIHDAIVLVHEVINSSKKKQII